MLVNDPHARAVAGERDPVKQRILIAFEVEAGPKQSLIESDIFQLAISVLKLMQVPLEGRGTASHESLVTGSGQLLHFVRVDEHGVYKEAQSSVNKSQILN